MRYDHFLSDPIPQPKTSAQLEEEKRLAEQAKNFPIKRIPYGGARRSLKFDRVNHYKRRDKSLSKELGDKGLSYQDYLTGMQIGRRATADDMRLLYTPKFAMNDEQL